MGEGRGKRRTGCASSMILHGLSFAVEGIVRRAGEVSARGGVSSRAQLAEGGRGGSCAAESEHGVGGVFGRSGERSLVVGAWRDRWFGSASFQRRRPPWQKSSCT